MRNIGAPCAQVFNLHFYAPKHRSMVEMHRPIGTRSSSSVQGKKAENLIVDRERMLVMSMLILLSKVLNVQQQIRSLNVQQQ